MNNYIPLTFFSKDIVQTFTKKFPNSAFIITNGGPIHSGIKSSTAYQSEILQIIRVEQSSVKIDTK